MATEIVTDVQGLTEVRTHYVDYTDDLAQGVTIVGGTATHTPPSGAASTPVVGSPMLGDILPVTLGPLSVTGRHILTVTATLSNGDVSVARLIVPVEWDSARSGMIEIIRELRGLGNVGSNDYTIGGQPYWTDYQLQEILDIYREDHHRHPTEPVASYEGGSVVYHDYYLGESYIEATTGGTAIFYLQDAAGSVIPSSDYTMDYRRGVATFAVDTGGESYWWFGRSYDIYRAAAEVWRRKASYYATQFDFQTDNHRLNKSTVYQQCLKMASYYEGLSATMGVVTIYRSDYPGEEV